jgi:Domain of unknown function (DUF4293)
VLEINSYYMLQRMQSIWLLFAAVCGFLTFKFSFFSGNKTVDQTKSFEFLTASSAMLLLVLTVAVICGTCISIFLYKNRKLQLRIVLVALIVSFLNIYLYYRETKNFVEGNYDLSAVISLAIPVFLLLALRGIYKDEKLVKSLDRLR